jgi:hypothetical protein
MAGTKPGHDRQRHASMIQHDRKMLSTGPALEAAQMMQTDRAAPPASYFVV